MSRVTFVIGSLQLGGAQRVMLTVAESMVERKHDVTLVTLDSEASDFFTPPAGVTRIALTRLRPTRNRVEALVANARTVTSVRRAVKNSAPDTVVSFIDGMNVVTLLATRRLGVRVVVSERTNPRFHQIG